MKSVAEKIRENTSPGPNGCIEWTGRIDRDGYGRMQARLAHRAAMEDAGYDLAGLQVDHLCRNRACVNPDHLEPVTARTNILRSLGMASVNARKIECVNGHAYSAANTYIRPDGSRDCRTCIRDRAQRYRAKKLCTERTTP